MKKTVTLYFNTDRTYITKIENDPTGLKLEYFRGTNNPVDMDSLNTLANDIGISEIETTLDSFEGDFDYINLVFPAESIMITQLPGNVSMTKEEIQKLISIELNRTFPKLDISHFEIEVFQMKETIKGVKKQLAVIFQFDDISILQQFLSKYGKEIKNKYVSQISAANAFLYNYPELKDKNSVIVGIQNNFLDFSVISNSQLIYYNILNYPDKNEIPLIIEEELNKVVGEITNDVSGGLFFYGSDLAKDTLLACWEIAMLFGVEGKRLNSFRMIKSDLGKREREYASRTMQIYPAALGGAIPNYFESIII